MIVNISQLFQLNNQPRAILRIRSYCSSTIYSCREVFFIAISMGEMRMLTNVLISLPFNLYFFVYYNFELYSSSVQIHVYITIVYILQR